MSSPKHTVAEGRAVAAGRQICTPGCASAKTLRGGMNCKCWCGGRGHGVLFLAGLSVLDRTRFTGDLQAELNQEIARSTARRAAAEILLNTRKKQHRRTREWQYRVNQRLPKAVNE